MAVKIQKPVAVLRPVRKPAPPRPPPPPGKKKPSWWLAPGFFFVALAVMACFPSIRTGMIDYLSGQPAPPPPPSRLYPERFKPDGLDGTNALDEVRRFVALGPRVSGTDGAARAADYLRQRLRDIGIPSSVDTFTHATPDGVKTFRNVLGTIPGTNDRLLILASHFDTKAGIDPAFVGANDSGSSTGLLLELGKVIRATKPSGPNILLAFLDGEECLHAYAANDGLHGSRRLVRTLSDNERTNRVVAFILLDMVGDSDLSITLPRNSTPFLTSLVFDASHAEDARKHFSLMDRDLLDDHIPFLRAGIRAVDIIDFEYGSVPGLNEYWHTTADSMDKLSAESLQVVGRVVLRTLNKLQNLPPR